MRLLYKKTAEKRENANCYTVFRNRFSSRLSETFIELPSGLKYSFSDLEEISSRLSSFFEHLGLKPGDRILVQAEKSPEVVFLYAACLRFGAIFTPTDPSYKTRELEYICHDLKPALIVCKPEDQKIFMTFCSKSSIKTLSRLDKKGSLAEESEYLPSRPQIFVATADDIACIFYTSGTTGKPKGALLTHQNLSANIRSLQQAWRFSSNDVLLHALSLFHIHGLLVAVNISLFTPCRLLFLPRYDADVLEFLPRATVFMTIPSNYLQLASDRDFLPSVYKNIRLFISGSAPLPEKTFVSFRERTGKAILERYGMTETLINVSNPIGLEKIGSCGKPLPGVELRITDDKGKSLETDKVGNIEVRGPNVFKGYWKDEQKSKESFRTDHFFITGDLGKIDKDGYLTIIGRVKDLIIVGGSNIYPKEVENYIDGIEGIHESVVFGVPDSRYGERVVAAVTLKKGSSLTQHDIVAVLRSTIASIKVPQQIYFLDQLPRNEMGKVQKNVLRERYTL